MNNKKDSLLAIVEAAMIMIACTCLSLVFINFFGSDKTIESTQLQHSQESIKLVPQDSIGEYQLEADVSVGENVPNEYFAIESTGAGFVTDKTVVLFPYKEGSFDFYESGELVASIPLDSVQTMTNAELENFKLALEIISFVHDKLKPQIYGKASDTFIFAAIEILPERFKIK